MFDKTDITIIILAALLVFSSAYSLHHYFANSSCKSKLEFMNVKGGYDMDNGCYIQAHTGNKMLLNM